MIRYFPLIYIQAFFPLYFLLLHWFAPDTLDKGYITSVLIGVCAMLFVHYYSCYITLYDRRIVSIKHQEIKLTQTEYNIVTLLSEHAGRVLTYAFIIHAIWGSADSGSIKKLQVNMANIRKKLGSKPGDNQYISNELGVGYRMYGNE